MVRLAGLLLILFRLSCPPGDELCLPAIPATAATGTATQAIDRSLIHHPGFTLLYNEETEQADWVAYELTAEEAASTAASRTDRFRTDPSIPDGSASDADYLRSGWDRGHLAPAADMRFSAEAMSASFFYSNMSPQHPSFNRGVWADLEAAVRTWAIRDEAVLVVSGPLFGEHAAPDDRIIGPNRVRIPDAYFKVILDAREEEIKGIAFILPNGPVPREKENGSSNTAWLRSHACSIDEAETASGFDFFPTLPDEIEGAVESVLDVGLWLTLPE